MSKKLTLIKFYMKRIYTNLLRLLKWIVFSVITGAVVGAVSILFMYCFNWVTDFRKEHIWIIFFLPVAGVIIVFLYSAFKYKNDKGTNLVLSTIHSEAEIPFKMAPLIFISTLITHCFGGSSGREGAALQLGGSIGNFLGKIFRFDDKDKRVVIMCGMAAAFTVVFGTPIAAVIFAMEVVSVGVMYYAALVPCVFASIVAYEAKIHYDIEGFSFFIDNAPDIGIISVSEIVLLAVLCAFVSVIFIITLHSLGDFYRDKLKNPYVRIIVSSAFIIIINLIVGNDDYMGAGGEVITRAVASGNARPEAFALKIILTALTLEAGFKGGEIVPSFFIGATFGCVFGQLFGISPQLCAGVGMMAVFCGVTNCPITSMFIAYEIFGFNCIGYFVIAISVSYLMSGYYGLYHDQTIVYSKYKTEYINRKARNK
ncbi:MAG: chloride channel protein [Lachnospiraceae bacterium]|nr:chloride channel protein [Lachnospiraceae bacterium]